MAQYFFILFAPLLLLYLKKLGFGNKIKKVLPYKTVLIADIAYWYIELDDNKKVEASKDLLPAVYTNVYW